MRVSFVAALLASASLLACEESPPRPPGTPTPRADTGVPDLGGGADLGAVDADDSDSGSMDAEADGGMQPDGGAPISIPDPGNGNNDWGLSVNNVCCSTPDQAYPVGVVTMDSGYVQGNIDPSTGDFFYVFRAGPALTTLTFTGFLTLDKLDLHDGVNMVFGPVIPPTSTGQNTATWPVMPNHVYVLHLHSPQSGFF